MIWGLAYALLLAALVVRFRMDEEAPAPLVPQPDEPLGLVRLHHAAFALVLLGAPVERMLSAPAPDWRLAGVALFAAGVLLYRVAGRALGDALSPFVEPRPGVPLVTEGVYGLLRHPIYVSQAMIAVGAPLTLGCRHTLAITAVTLVVLAVRIYREEEALARTFPDYPRYAAATKRLLPFVF